MLRNSLVITLAFAAGASATLDYKRFHCVAKDNATGNYMFRSNMPIATNASGVATADDFAYDEIKSYVASRGEEECGSAPPEDFYLVEVTLNNALDDDDGLLAVRAWHGWPVNTSMTDFIF